MAESRNTGWYHHMGSPIVSELSHDYLKIHLISAGFYFRNRMPYRIHAECALWKNNNHEKRA